MVKQITIQIADMHCPNCAFILEKIEDRLDGVLMAEASYRKGQMIVRYDEAKLNETQIKNAVEGLGYRVSAFELNES